MFLHCLELAPGISRLIGCRICIPSMVMGGLRALRPSTILHPISGQGEGGVINHNPGLTCEDRHVKICHSNFNTLGNNTSARVVSEEQIEYMRFAALVCLFMKDSIDVLLLFSQVIFWFPILVANCNHRPRAVATQTSDVLRHKCSDCPSDFNSCVITTSASELCHKSCQATNLFIPNWIYILVHHCRPKPEEDGNFPEGLCS